MSKLDTILSDLEAVARIAEFFPIATLPATAADQILQIIQAGVRAHEATTGKPIDPTLLHQIAPIS